MMRPKELMKQASDVTNLLKQSVGEVLQQGVDLLEAIDDRTYSPGNADAFHDGGSVGGHFRHCLEFINCFLEGAASVGWVDYNLRKRDRLIETQREHAIAEYLRTIAALTNVNLPESKAALSVKPEEIARDEDLWCASSVARELEFLHSHTIHHFALIAFKLRMRGIVVSDEFGVAPSTLSFWRQKKAADG